NERNARRVSGSIGCRLYGPFKISPKFYVIAEVLLNYFFSRNKDVFSIEPRQFCFSFHRSHQRTGVFANLQPNSRASLAVSSLSRSLISFTSVPNVERSIAETGIAL